MPNEETEELTETERMLLAPLGPGLTMGIDVTDEQATAIVVQMVDGVMHVIWEGIAKSSAPAAASGSPHVPHSARTARSSRHPCA